MTSAETSTAASSAASSATSTPPAVPELATQGLRSGYGRRVVVDGVDVTIPSGRITVIVGANACGKSTLLKTMARILAPVGGQVLLDGTPIAVADLVGRGRHPHQSMFRSTGAEDRRIVEESLLATRTAELADRSIDELSGGQRQRVWIAMALAQRTPVLLLDEPTTFLDLTHQVEVLDLLTDLNRERGTTVVMVLHDINLSARYADHIIAMRAGRVVAAGPPREVVDAELVSTVFDLDSDVITDPVSGTPLILPKGRHHVREASHGS